MHEYECASLVKTNVGENLRVYMMLEKDRAFVQPVAPDREKRAAFNASSMRCQTRSRPRPVVAE